MSLDALTLNELLTEAFHQPTLLNDTEDFAASNMRFKYADPPAANRALVLAWKSSKTYAVIVFGTLCAISVAVGVLVGVLSHDATLGLTVGSTMATVLTVPVALLAYLAR